MYNPQAMNIREGARNIGLRVVLIGAAALGSCAVSTAISEFTDRNSTYIEEGVIDYMQVDLNQLAAEPANFKNRYVAVRGYHERENPTILPLEGQKGLEQATFHTRLFEDSSKIGASIELREIIITRNKASDLPPKAEGTVYGKVIEEKTEDRTYYLVSISNDQGVIIMP